MAAYLDCNATTQPLPEVVAAVTDSLVRGWGNPSSVHRAGIDARRTVELARESVARLVGAGDREIVFTSGGTEGATLAIEGSLQALQLQGQQGRRVLVSMKTEHSAVREACEALAGRGLAEVAWLHCDAAGNAVFASIPMPPSGWAACPANCVRCRLILQASPRTSSMDRRASAHSGCAAACEWRRR
jgi:cysteine sulfinate desulfinase/cysteine desulfurase-like protein